MRSFSLGANNLNFQGVTEGTNLGPAVTELCDLKSSIGPSEKTVMDN